MELTLAARKAITKSQLSRWPKATKSEKSAILDAICRVTGWHRDHARKAIRTALADQARGGPLPRRRREPARKYDDAVIELLTRCWASLDGPAGKRLHPGLPEVLANMTRHGHLDGIDERVVEAVLSMSPATIDRRLAPAREGLETRKQISHTRPGSMLKSSIPMKTWREWNDTEPGFIQIDLVGHEGGDNNGHFFYTLDATDIATGWTESITVRSKGEKIVSAGLNELVLRFPFHISGIHSDNGSQGEFNWSSQHLDGGGVQQWRRMFGRRRRVMCRRVRVGSGVRTGRCGRRCVRLGGLSRRGRCSGSSGI